MHDPMTVAFYIKYPWKSRYKIKDVYVKDSGYRDNFITIWHIDPEKDGTDDSCGWFLRSRHLDKDVLAKIVHEFEFDWDSTFCPSEYDKENGCDDKEDYTPDHRVYNTGWFHPNGQPNFSVTGVTLNMFYKAALQIFESKQKVNGFRYQKKASKYMQKNLFDIMYFAENSCDSLFDGITRKFERGCNEEYTPEKRKERINSMASCIYSYIMRDLRPWYKHPRWHIHHWRIQIHPLQKILRYLFVRCCKCGKRFGYNETPYGSWYGDKVFHSSCDDSCKPLKESKNELM